MILLFFNALVYFFLFFKYYKKDKGINVFNYLLLFYAGIATMGVVSMYTGIYEDTFGSKSNTSISIIPYIFCCISYIVFFYPFRKLSKNVEFKMPYIKYFDVFVSIWIIIMICYCVMMAIEASISISTGLAEAYEARHIEGESLFDYGDNFLLRRLRYIGVVFQNCTVPIIILYCLTCLKQHKKKYTVITLVILCFLPNFLGALGQGSRGQMFSLFNKMIFFVLLFKEQIDRKIKSYIYVGGIAFTLVMLSYSLLITTQRLEEKQKETPIASIARYFGESFPNLGYTFWDNVKYHPMGERLFPEIFGYSINERFGSTDESYAYWWNITGVPVLTFKTLFGDLYIEFGVIGALLFIFLASSLFSKMMNGHITYYNLGIAYIYFQICNVGFAGLTMVSGFSITIWLFTLLIGYTLKKINQ